MTEFGGTDLANTTSITPLALGITILAGILMFVLPKKYILIPFIAASCYITLGQRLVIFDVDFTMMRILIIVGWLRLLIRNELSTISLNMLDILLIVWCFVKIVAYSLLWLTPGALVYQLGSTYDILGMYFLYRFLLSNFDDIKNILMAISLILLPLMLFMVTEAVTGKNLFSMFGGVPEITTVRGGRVRSQGPFRHPILAGTLGASFIAIYVAYFWQKGKDKIIAGIGIVSSTLIVFASSSSGPALAYIGAVFSLFLWPVHNFMRVVRWVILAGIFAIQIFMTAPIWYIFAHISNITGGTGYHRSYLLDRAIANFGDWWLVGTKSTANWGYYLFDVTNGYLNEGVEGGIISVILFIAIIAVAFRQIGKTIYSLQYFPTSIKLLYWSLGAAVFAHAVTFLSVSYFDQIKVFWYLQLALISNLGNIIHFQIKQINVTGEKVNAIFYSKST